MNYHEAKKSDDLAETLATLSKVGVDLHAALHELDEAKAAEREASSRETTCINKVRELQKQYDALDAKVREYGGKHSGGWGA